MVEIRKATPEDAAALGSLGAMLVRAHYDFDNLRFLQPRPGIERGYAAFLGSILESNDDVVFVADDGGSLAGYVYAGLEPMSWKELRGPAGFVHDVVVSESARRRGIAAKLMAAAIAWLRERGAPRVVLWSAAANQPAQDLFRRLGFRTTMVEMTLELPE